MTEPLRTMPYNSPAKVFETAMFEYWRAAFWEACSAHLAVITEADRMILVDIKTGWFKLLERHGIDVGHCPWTAEPPDGVGEANPGFGRRTK
jgi:hypothetical protein